MFEDTKCVTRSHNSKQDRKYNDQKKKEKGKKGIKQWSTEKSTKKTNDWTARI